MFMTGQTTTAAVEAVAKTWNASGQIFLRTMMTTKTAMTAMMTMMPM